MAGPDSARSDLAKARKVMALVFKHRISKLLFNNPVDASVPGLEDYHDIVQTPMDFGTIVGRLDAGAEAGWGSGSYYKDVGQVLADVLLVFKNCSDYNSAPADAPTREAAEELQEHFVDKWKGAGLSMDAPPAQQQGASSVMPPAAEQLEPEWQPEADVTARFNVVADGVELPLRVLDEFKLQTTGDAPSLVLPDALADGLVQAKGLLRGPPVAAPPKKKKVSGASAATMPVTLDIVDWCTQYSADKPTVWLITKQAWYKLLAPSAAYAEQYASLASTVATASEGVAAMRSDPSSTSKAVAERLLSGRKAGPSSRGGGGNAGGRRSGGGGSGSAAAGAAAVASAADAEFVAAQLASWQHRDDPNYTPAAGRKSGGKRKADGGPSSEPRPGKRRGGEDAVTPKGGAAGPGGRAPGEPSTDPGARKYALLGAPGSAAPSDSKGGGAGRSKSRLAGSGTASESRPSRMRQRSSGGDSDGGAGSCAEDGAEWDSSVPDVATGGYGGTTSSWGTPVQGGPVDGDEDSAAQQQEDSRGKPPKHRPWLLPKPDRKLTAEERHARELELRRLRYHAQRSEMLKEQQRQRDRERQQREARERAAHQSRGTPPPPSSTFRLPSAIVPELLCVWDFAHAFAEPLGLVPFPFWRLEAALLPAAHAPSAAAQIEADRAMQQQRRPHARPKGGAAGVAGKAASLTPGGSEAAASADGDDEDDEHGGSQAGEGGGGGVVRRSSRRMGPQLRITSVAFKPGTSSADVGNAEVQVPPTDPDGGASAALLRDVHTALANAIAGQPPSLPSGAAAGAAAQQQQQGQRGRRPSQQDPPPPWAWVEATAKALLGGPEGIVDDYTKELALRLLYGDYCDLSLMERVRVLVAMMHLALASEAVREVVLQRVDTEWRTRRRARRRRTEGGNDDEGSGDEDEDDDEGDDEVGRAQQQAAQQRQAEALPGSPEEWASWMESSRLGLRLYLGQDVLGRRYWALGGKAGAWRVWVETVVDPNPLEGGSTWGWYEGASMIALLDWLRLGSIGQEAALLESLEKAPLLRHSGQPGRPPLSSNQSAPGAAPLDARDLSQRRSDAYRTQAAPLLRGESNWPKLFLPTPGAQQPGPHTPLGAGVNYADKVLHAVDAMLGVVHYWFKGPTWVNKHTTVLDLVQNSKGTADLSKAVQQLETMLFEAGALRPSWRTGCQAAWRRGLSHTFDAREVLLYLSTLQEHCRWDAASCMPRNVFLKLEQDHRCTLWIPEPNTEVVLLRTGLLMHVDRYMRQLGLVEEPEEEEEQEEEGGRLHGGGGPQGPANGGVKAEPKQEEYGAGSGTPGPQPMDEEGGADGAMREEGREDGGEDGGQQGGGGGPTQVPTPARRRLPRRPPRPPTPETRQLQAHWQKLRDRVAALRPVERFKVASLNYQRALDPEAKEEIIDGVLNTAAWPVAWMLLRPSRFGPAGQRPLHDLVAPLHVDASLPDYLVQADVYDKGMRRDWQVDDRFRMFFAAHKTAHNKVTATGTYYRGTILEVTEPPPVAPGAAPAPHDPWEALLVQWDSSATEEGAVERVNPWEIDVDPEEERRLGEERRKAEEAAARAARAEAKAKRLEMENLQLEPGSFSAGPRDSSDQPGSAPIASAAGSQGDFVQSGPPAASDLQYGMPAHAVSTSSLSMQQQPPQDPSQPPPRQTQVVQPQLSPPQVVQPQQVVDSGAFAGALLQLQQQAVQQQAAQQQQAVQQQAAAFAIAPAYAAPIPGMALAEPYQGAPPKRTRAIADGSPVPKPVLERLRQYDKVQMRNILTNFYRQVKGKFKVPIFAHQELDLDKVFWEVQERGGYELVTSQKLWKDVCRSLNVDLRGQTSASYNMRLNYEKCLLEFERYLASGQYEADVAAGVAPSPDEVNVAVRNVQSDPKRPHQAGSSGSPALSGMSTEQQQQHHAAVQQQRAALAAAAAAGGLTGLTLKIGGQPAVRLGAGGFGVDASGVQLQQHLIPVLAGGGTATSQGGPYAGSFSELLAGGEGPQQQAMPLGPRQEPWLRLVAPPGAAGQQQQQPSTPTCKGWVAHTDVPPVAFADAALYQQLPQQLPSEPFGSFLQRQGDVIIGLKLLRLSPESGAWAEVEVQGYSEQDGGHALRYDGTQPSPYRLEWAQLGSLSEAELRPHPRYPVPPYSARQPPGLDPAAVQQQGSEAMRAIMQALLQGQSPEALHQFVDMAARQVSSSGGGGSGGQTSQQHSDVEATAAAQAAADAATAAAAQQHAAAAQLAYAQQLASLQQQQQQQQGMSGSEQCHPAAAALAVESGAAGGRGLFSDLLQGDDEDDDEALAPVRPEVPAGVLAVPSASGGQQQVESQLVAEQQQHVLFGNGNCGLQLPDVGGSVDAAGGPEDDPMEGIVLEDPAAVETHPTSPH